MKKIYLSTLLILFAIKIFGQAPTNGLVAYYPFNGDAQDAVGANHGIVSGATITTDRFGQINKAYNFDGNDYISIGNKIISGNQITLSTWFFSNGQNLGIGQHLISTGNQNDYGFQLNSNAELIGYLYTGNSTYNQLNGNLVSIGWNHAVLKYDGALAKLYINGVLKTQKNVSGNIDSWQQDFLAFGVYYLNGVPTNSFFNGKIDDIRIYNRALTDTEVQQLYQAEAPPIDITTGLVAHYKMDGNAQDASGFNNHGTQQGGVNFTTATDRFGVAGKAAGFDSVDDIIVLPETIINYQSSEYSISSWVKPNDNIGHIFYSGTASGEIAMIYDKQNNRFQFQVKLSNDTWYNVYYTNVIPNQYYHLIGTYKKGEKVKLFVNGQSIGNLSIPNLNLCKYPICNNFNIPSSIGARNYNGLNFKFKGTLDEIRVYNRTLSDADVLALYNLENNANLTNVKIEPILENINQTNYVKIPKEATVHHYFLAKDNTTGAKLKDVTVVYQYGPFLHQSIPTDTSGLIDLNVMVGGLNPNNSDDDWSPVGKQTVTFHSLLVGNVTGSNAFTPFDITVIDKAEPIDEEMGIGIGVQVGNDAFSDNYKDKFDVGSGIKLKIGMSTGIKLGITGDRYIKIKPISNSNWNVYFNGGLKAFVGLEVGSGISFGDRKLGIGLNLQSNAQLDGAIRSEKGYNFDLTKKFDVFKLASLLFSMNKVSPGSLELAYIFDRLATQFNTAITDISVKSEFAYGMGVNVAGSVIGRAKIYPLNLPGYGNIPEVSIENSVSAGIRFNDNVIFESVKGVGNSFANSIAMSGEANASIQGIVALTKGNKKNIPTDKSQPLSFFNGSFENNFLVKREEDFFQNPTSGLVSISSKSSEINLDPNTSKLYNVEYKNTYKYGANVLRNLYATTFNPTDYSLLQLNAIASFLTNKSNSLVGSMIVNQGLAGNFFRQAYDLNTFMTKASKQFNYPFNEIELNSTQDVSLIDRIEKNLNFTGFKSLDFKVNLNSWKTNVHNKTQGKYINSLDRTLITIDYPDIYSNLELPTTTPIEDIQTFIDNALTSAGQATIDFANQIITKVSNLIDQSVTLILTNFNLPRFNNSGVKMYDPSNKNLNIANTPSVFTFTIPGTTFAQNTAIDFKFFYPSNEINAVTSADTFRIISDVFTLTAKLNSQYLNQAPNGNFTIQTDFSSSDLTLASLPSNLLPVVLFLPRGSTTWQQIGAINTTINFNQLGDYGIGVKISNDLVPPIIQVNNPTTYSAPNYFEVTFSDLQTGIDWKNSRFVANGVSIPINRINNTNTFRINISDIPPKPSGIFIVEVYTSDLADNERFYSNIYPCEESKIIQGLDLDPDNPILKKALYFIESTTKTPQNKSVFFKAGNKIELKPGFETNGTVFKAEIGGCEN